MVKDETKVVKYGQSKQVCIYQTDFRTTKWYHIISKLGQFWKKTNSFEVFRTDQMVSNNCFET
jgi:hypothetical protein